MQKGLLFNNALRLVCILLLVAPFLGGIGYGQDVKSITKELEKATKDVIKNPIRVPGVDIQMSGARAITLTHTVNEAANEALKQGLKEDIWAAESLSESEVLQIANSNTPVSTFFEITSDIENNALNTLLKTNMRQAGLEELLDAAKGDPGFYSSGSDKSTYVSDVYHNLLASLDNAAKERFTPPNK